MQIAEGTVNGLIAAVLLVLAAPSAHEGPELMPLWVAIATAALLLTSSLTAIIFALAVATHVEHRMKQHELRDPLPTQPMRDTDPAPGSIGDSSEISMPPPPLPVHSMPSSFEGDDLSSRMYMPSPRGPAEVLLGLHRAAGTADAALEAAKAAVRGARHAAELAQAARVQRTPGASPLRGLAGGGAAAVRTPRPRPPGRRGPYSPVAVLPVEPPPQPPRPAIDVLLPSPRGPLQVLLERSGRSGHTI